MLLTLLSGYCLNKLIDIYYVMIGNQLLFYVFKIHTRSSTSQLKANLNLFTFKLETLSLLPCYLFTTFSVY